MITEIASTNGVGMIFVFLEGLLSFFSPCVIPLIPVYMGYLAGNGKKVTEDGTIQYDQKKVFLHTLFFVFGISFAFFVLGLSFTALGSFFNTYKDFIVKIGGLVIIVLGMFQLDLLNLSFLQKERKIAFSLEENKMNPLLAFGMGFTFSFAWTPCIGPALSSVLILASGAENAAVGNAYVMIYAFGFLIPFLLLGLFTTKVLNFLRAKQKLLKYTIKIGGIILIIMGLLMIMGWMNRISGFVSSFSKTNSASINNQTSSETDVSGDVLNEEELDTKENTDTEVDLDTEEDLNTEDQNDTQEESDETKLPANDFTLTDQYGIVHTLSDYKGKVVFLNFWATWCPPCKEELPDIEALYQEYNLNKDEVVFLGITNPSSEAYPNNSDESIDVIKDFLVQNEYTFPVLFDETGAILQNYYIQAFPTTFIIDKEGNIVKYIPGMLEKEDMISYIQEGLK